MSLTPAILSVGMVSCAGRGLESAGAILDGRRFLSKLSVAESRKHSEKLVGEAKISKCGKLSRCAAMLMSALEDAFDGIPKCDPKMLSLWFGTSIGGIWETENMLEKKFLEGGKENPEILKSYECSTIAELAAKKIGSMGECATYSTACSSSSLALARACSAIETGECEVAVVCGADALSRITVNGFGSLLLLSEGVSKPFAEDRDGINLGEAAGVAVISSEDFALKSGAEIMAYISGWSSTCDAYHPTAPRPDGEDLARAMSECLSGAQTKLYLAHGTGTIGNDAAELAAISRVFGGEKPRTISVKDKIGHTLGASGIVNMIVALEEMKRSGESSALFSSIGFGGNNSCALLSSSPSKTAPKKIEPLYIYGAGLSHSEAGNLRDESDILKEVPPLKKRKWAKLQKMALEAANSALENAEISAPPTRIGVCLGTGLGMVSETAKFLESYILKGEALPTAFTNSVHNACSSLLSQQKGFRALNGAATAKEVSFEAALKEAWGEIATNRADAFLIGGADEISPYAERFLKKRGESTSDISELACVYFAGKFGVCLSKPLAKITSCSLARSERNPKDEQKIFEKFLLSENLSLPSLKKIFLFFGGERKRKFADSIASLFPPENVDYPQSRLGKNYSLSATAIREAIEMGGRGIFASCSFASSGMRSYTIFEIL